MTQANSVRILALLPTFLISSQTDATTLAVHLAISSHTQRTIHINPPNGHSAYNYLHEDQVTRRHFKLRRHSVCYFNHSASGHQDSHLHIPSFAKQLHQTHFASRQFISCLASHHQCSSTLILSQNLNRNSLLPTSGKTRNEIGDA